MNRLALLGGKRTVGKRFPPHITVDESDKRELCKVIDSGVLSAFAANHHTGFLGGKRVRDLEKRWAEKFRVRFCVSFNSATSALHAALFAAGIEPGDEVILPPSTMSGCSAVILALNAIPVFADEDPESLCIDADLLEKRVTKKTKAIMPVHLTGNICEMDKIMKVARRNNLIVVEDASQAPYGMYRDRPVGTIGNIGVFSLNCHKIIQTGEGGIAVTNNGDLAHRMRLFRNHGESYAHRFNEKDPPLLAGLNLRMTELQAAVGMTQLKKLPRLTAHRIKLANYLTQLLDGVEWIRPIKIYPGCKNVYYIYHMKYLEDEAGIKKSTFVKAVNAEGVPLYSDYCKPLYMQPIFQRLSAYGRSGCPFACRFARKKIGYPKGLCRQSESINRTSVWLDIVRYPLTKDDMKSVFKCFKKVIDSRDALREYEKRSDRD